MKPSEDQESGPNIDPQAQADEGPVHAVTLAPFFMSKYEMTQGQWLRFMHENPSHYKPGTPAGEHAITLLNPVEFVDWNQCKLALERLGLMLPTEAQWEYAARAGTTSVRWTGDDREALRGAANIADQSAKRAGMDLPTIKDWPELDDGYPVHAPVDAFRPNPFGLHNVLGNLWEWCRDGHEKTYTAKNQEGDGEALVQGAVFRVCRGGSSNLSAEWVRSARRMQSPPVGRYDWLGVRPARTVTPTLE